MDLTWWVPEKILQCKLLNEDSSRYWFIVLGRSIFSLVGFKVNEEVYNLEFPTFRTTPTMLVHDYV